MDWRINHCPGERMLADIGTKPLAAQRFEELKVLCGMSEEKMEDRTSEERSTSSTTTSVELPQALRMIAMAALLTEGATLEVKSEARNVLELHNYVVDFEVYTILGFMMVMVYVVVNFLGSVKARKGIATRGTRTFLFAVLVGQVEAPNGDGRDEDTHGRREDEAAMWMFIAVYTFLIVVAVNVFQWVFSTWRTLAENVEKGLQEAQHVTQHQRRRILAAQRSLREAERRRNEAEDELVREIVDAYHPETASEYNRRRNRPRSSQESEEGRSSRRSSRRSRSDCESEEGRESRDDSYARGSEEYRRTDEEESQDTRDYASGEERNAARFNVFHRREHGQREGAEDADMEGESAREVNLPEHQGPGRYVEDAARGLRRRLGLIEEDQSLDNQDLEEAAQSPDHEGHDHGELGGDDSGHQEREDQQNGEENQGEEEIPTVDEVVEDQEPGLSEGVEPDTEPGAGPIPEEEVRDEGDGDDHAEVRGELPDHNVLITPNGTRYHLTVACPTLANTRRILRSIHCEFCCRSTPPRQRALVHVARPGETAHFDPRCPHVGLRCPTPYPCCQMCPSTPTTR